MITDQELVYQALKGNEQAFSSIVKKYQSVVATTAMNMLADQNDAQDVGQETFIRLYKSLAKFQGNSSLKTYITRICINLCLNKLKQRKRQWERHTSIDSEHIVLSTDQDLSFEDRELINKALQKLGHKHRTVIVLRMIQGYSTKETSEILKLPQGTVLSRLKRGMEKLKAVLEMEFNYERDI